MAKIITIPPMSKKEYEAHIALEKKLGFNHPLMSKGFICNKFKSYEEYFKHETKHPMKALFG
jgi:hypothetical protein